MKAQASTAHRVVLDLTFVEALALYKIALSYDHRMMNLEWPQDIDEIDELAAALQVQLAGIVGP